MSTLTQKEIRAAASAIANVRGNRRGVPTVVNILEMLPKKLFDEVMEDAKAALEAASAAQTKVYSGSIDALKEVARLQGENLDLLAHLKGAAKTAHYSNKAFCAGDFDSCKNCKEWRDGIAKATGAAA